MRLKHFAQIALAALAGCVSLPDVERSYRECLLNNGSPSYVATAEMKSAECKR